MSIRLRLAIWYGTLLALVFGATLTVAFIAHVRTHESNVDESLRDSWEHSVSELGVAGMPMSMRSLTSPAQAANSPTASWLIVSGALPLAIGDTSDTVLSRFDSASAGDGLRDADLAGARVRSYSGDVPGLTGGRLVVAASMSAFDASRNSLAFILGAMGVAGIAFVVTGGWVICAGALRPIAKMTETAHAIALSRGFAHRSCCSGSRRTSWASP